MERSRQRCRSTKPKRRPVTPLGRNGYRSTCGQRVWHGLWCAASVIYRSAALQATQAQLDRSRSLPWTNDASGVGRARTVDWRRTHPPPQREGCRWGLGRSTFVFLQARAPDACGSGQRPSFTPMHTLHRTSSGQCASPAQQRGPCARSASARAGRCGVRRSRRRGSASRDRHDHSVAV
jgi:hypothetical protein